MEREIIHRACKVTLKRSFMKLILGEACIEKSKGVFECRRTPHNMSNQRMHWVVKGKWGQAWKDEVLAAVLNWRKGAANSGKWPFDKHQKAKVMVKMSKVALFDTDGAYNAAKPVVDGLKLAEVIEDDSTRHIDLKVEQIKVDHKKEERVEIEVLPWKE